MANSIFPRYESSVSVASPETPLKPTESIAAAQGKQFGQALQSAGQTGMAVTQKLKELKDYSAASEQYMLAVREMQNEIETYKGDDAKEAKKKFESFLAKKTPEWYKGLSKEAGAKLERDLFPKTLENTALSHKIEHRYDVGKYAVGAVDIELQLTRDVNMGQIQGDPKDSKWYKKYVEHLDIGVKNGLYDADNAAKDKERVLQNASYAMAYRQVIDAPEVFVKLYNEFEANKKDGVPNEASWLKNIGSKELAQLKGQADERIRVLKNDKWTDKERERTEMERQDVIVRERAEKNFAKKYAAGKLTLQEIDLYDELRGTTGEKAHFWRQLVLTQSVQGGPGDPLVRRELGLEVAEANAGTSDPAKLATLRKKVQDAVLAYKVPRDEGFQWINSLNETAKSENTQINRDTQTAKQILLQGLSFSGQFQKPTGEEVFAKTRGLQELARNATLPEGQRKHPLQLVNEMLPELQARARPRGQAQVSEGRRAHGIGPAPEAGKPDLELDRKAAEYSKRAEELAKAGKIDSPEYRDLRRKMRELREIDAGQNANADTKARREESRQLNEDQKARRVPPVPTPKEQ